MRSWLKPARAKTMSPTEAAWLAGFIDGEGSITCHKGGRDQAFDCWILSVPNTNRDALVRCQEITGTGSITNKNRKRPAHHKEQWQWRVNSQRDIASICKQILPFCIIKRTQIDAFFLVWQDVEQAA